MKRKSNEERNRLKIRCQSKIIAQINNRNHKVILILNHINFNYEEQELQSV